MAATTDFTDYELANSMVGKFGETVSAIPKPRYDNKMGYWKRCENTACERHTNDHGFIQVGPMRTRFQDTYDYEMGKHAKPLSENYLMPDPKNPKHINDELTNNNRNRQITCWVPLVRNGGLHEMPIAQMIALNWNRNPLISAAIPELKAFIELPCEHGCPTTGVNARLFDNHNDLMAHYSSMHKDIVAPKAMADTINSAMAGQSDQFHELLKALTAALKEK